MADVTFIRMSRQCLIYHSWYWSLYIF